MRADYVLQRISRERLQFMPQFIVHEIMLFLLTKQLRAT
jgi:hypothetical protein